MHSPAPMPQSGGGYSGMQQQQMNPNQYGPPGGGCPPGNFQPQMHGMRGPPQGMPGDDMQGGGWNGPPQHMQHLQNGPLSNNPHANMMSPRPPSGPGPNQVMNSPHHGQGMSPHPQQIGPPNQAMYNNGNNNPPGPHPGMMSQSPHPPPGMMSHSPRPGMMSHSPHPQPPGPGMSPHPQQQQVMMGPGPANSPLYGQQVPGSGPPHNMGLQSVHNQMLPTNRVMSPSQQQNTNGMMSPHGPPPGPPGGQYHPGQGPPGMMHPHMNQGPPRMNGPMSGNMMPPHPQHGMMPQDMLPPNHPHRMMSPHGQGPPGMMGGPPHGHHGGHPMMGPPGQMGGPQPPNAGKIYPPNQPMIFNPQNPNAPPIHPCGVCHREVQGDSEEGLMCESGCNFWFHRICIQMSPEAYHFLKNEVYAEWVCDTCIQTKRIAPIKFKS